MIFVILEKKKKERYKTKRKKPCAYCSVERSRKATKTRRIILAVFEISVN